MWEAKIKTHRRNGWVNQEGCGKQNIAWRVSDV